MVWVTQYVPQFNILPAKKYGDLKVLCQEGQGATFATGAAINKLKFDLSSFDKDKDFLLLIGDPVLIAITSAIASFWTNGEFNLLKWDRQEREYIPVKVKI